MPTYDYYCPKCYTIYKDIKLTFEQKKNFTKDCDSCNIELIQKVAPLRFKLEGNGWYANNDHPYAITQTELNNNLDFEKRKEDEIYAMQENDMKVKEI